MHEPSGGLHAVHPRHDDIHEDDVRPDLGDLAQGLLAVAGLADDAHPWILLNELAKGQAADGRVVDQEDRDRMAATRLSRGTHRSLAMVVRSSSWSKAPLTM